MPAANDCFDHCIGLIPTVGTDPWLVSQWVFGCSAIKDGLSVRIFFRGPFGAVGRRVSALGRAVLNDGIPDREVRDSGDSAAVRKGGLEPPRPKAQEPKSCVSANFTTRARRRRALFPACPANAGKRSTAAARLQCTCRAAPSARRKVPLPATSRRKKPRPARGPGEASPHGQWPARCTVPRRLCHPDPPQSWTG